MLPGEAEKRRTSSLFITLAPPSRGPPLAQEEGQVRAPPKKTRARPDQRRRGPSPTQGAQEGFWGAPLGRPTAGGTVSSPPSSPPSSLRDPDQDGFSLPPPPPPLGCSEPSSLQAPSAFPGGQGQLRILSPKFDRAAGRDRPAEKAASADVCAFCHKALFRGAPAVQAMNKQYHARCFTCRECHAALAGQHFFQREGRPLCTACYQSTLEKCAKCRASIRSQIVRTLGSAYHPECFVCVECGRAIGAETFAVDGEGRLHCLGDFYRKFAPVCSACEEPITPRAGRDDYRIECLGRSFHEDCYRCQSCRVLLSPDPMEDGCYPLNGCLFCKACHIQHKASPH